MGAALGSTGCAMGAPGDDEPTYEAPSTGEQSEHEGTAAPVESSVDLEHDQPEQDDDDHEASDDGLAEPPTAPGTGEDDEAVPEQPVGEGDDDVEAQEPPTAQTLRVEGRYLLDACGERLVMRGVEQVFGLGIDVGGSWDTLVDEIAKSGANAVRVLPNLEQLSVADVDAILTRITGHHMVAFLSPGDRSWFARPDVKEMLDRHRAWLIVDAFQEPNYDDRTRWQADAIGAIQTVRDAGYDVPITVLANQYGRDLPALLEHGSHVVAADALGNTILGWQAYWGSGGWYQGHYGMSLSEAVANAAAQPFPIQAGIDGFADPGDPMDYAGTMEASQQNELGWLWWDWYNPFGPSNNLTVDGTSANLTSLGTTVVRDHAQGLKVARRACANGG